MWAGVVTAAVAAFRVALLNSSREYGQLLDQSRAAAVRAASAFLAGGVFQKLTYPATIAAFVFINRHNVSLTTKNRGDKI